MPIPLQKLFTYEVSKEEFSFLKAGMRVAVPFGKSKIYTGIVYDVHNNAPQVYEAKEIHQILDDTAIVTKDQLKLWLWIADYYMCTLGDVMRAALPSSLLLQSESKITLDRNFTEEKSLSDKEFMVFEALQYQDFLDIDTISAITSRKNVMPIIKSLLEKKVISIHEILYEKYLPKYIKYIRLSELWENEKMWIELLRSLEKAKKQKELVLCYFQEKATNKNPIPLTYFLKKYHFSHAIAKALMEKEIFEIYEVKEDRIKMGDGAHIIPSLNQQQAIVLQEIHQNFITKDIVLLHGVTGGGKTEIYMHLIKEQLETGNQVLYLVPEIALTTQLLERLKRYFGESITVFHSRYNLNERVEVWQNIIDNQSKSRLIVGARSAVLLPFQNLSLIIIDEEHETSYKQYEPAPRYHARDTAIVLGKQKKAKVLLGTATPSIESYFNVKNEKYGIVNLVERFGNSILPKIDLVNIAVAKQKKQMQGHFSLQLIEAIKIALNMNEQVILFQNRRGYAPVVECNFCGYSPQCPNCDVSLTYHKSNHELRCHYCGSTSKMLDICPACNNPSLSNLGFGTEQLEDELKEIFPTNKIARMDFDTTRGKEDYFNIISSFQNQEIDILVGTQMLSKGLDFSNVSLVGVINADSLLNFPDFRAHERSFQMLVQVSGRAGRSDKQGTVIIQTHNPDHSVLQWVTYNNFKLLFESQLTERWMYKYPPYFRIIKISLKHKNFQVVTDASEWLGDSLKNYFGEWVLGPTNPAIGRIRNLYIKDILLKIPPEQSVNQTKKQLQKIKNYFLNIAQYRSVRIIVDVDNF